MKVAILGSGNIGTDLMYKIRREPSAELVMVSGVDPRSGGLARARSLGYRTSTDGVQGILALDTKPDVVFDATTARAHLEHAPMLEDAGIIAIDLTPAAIGPMVVPALNLDLHIGAHNINLISCAAQATVPIVAAIASAVSDLRYAEIVSTVASESAGPGTRQNIDEFTHKTRKAVEALGGAAKGKAIAIFNPADPPPIMRNTVYALADGIDEDRLRAAVAEMAQRVQEYVPGYSVFAPTVDGDKIAVFSAVEGAGDFLPRHAGNLDIITAAAVGVLVRLVAARSGGATPEEAR